MRDRWNLNLSYHPRFLDAAPKSESRVLEVGCGDGILAFDLADAGHDVIGIDSDRASIDRCRSDVRTSTRTRFAHVDLLDEAGLLACGIEPVGFDLIAMNAVLHHLDAEEGLRAVRRLLRPGGRLAVVGFAQPSNAGDRARAVRGRLLKLRHQLDGSYWDHNAVMCWPPPLSMDEMKTLVATELPGATFEPLLSGRYGLEWQAPDEASESHGDGTLRAPAP